MSTYCPRCGTARMGSFRYCRSCQFDFDELQTQALTPQPVAHQGPAPTPAPASSGIFSWVLAAASLVGFIWLWVNLDTESILIKVMLVGVLGLVWVGIVFAVGGFVAMLLGLGDIVTRPFRK